MLYMMIWKATMVKTIDEEIVYALALVHSYVAVYCRVSLNLWLKMVDSHAIHPSKLAIVRYTHDVHM